MLYIIINAADSRIRIHTVELAVVADSTKLLVLQSE